MDSIKNTFFRQRNTRSLFKLCLCLVLAAGLLMPNGLAAFESNEFPFRQGETVDFAIKKFGVKAGEASLVFNGKDKLNGKEVYLITFTAKALNFFDEEKIYIDTVSFYPVAVHRDLNIWGQKEKITEEYMSEQGTIKVTKEAKGKTTTQVLEKEGPIDNIYCFIYRFRMRDENKKGDTFVMNLPTKDVKIKYVDNKKLRLGGKKYDSLYLKSVPKQYKVWFDAGGQKIPLRIDGSVGIMSTSMVMVDYQK